LNDLLRKRRLLEEKVGLPVYGISRVFGQYPTSRGPEKGQDFLIVVRGVENHRRVALVYMSARSALVRRDRRALLSAPDKLSLGLLDAFKGREIVPQNSPETKSPRGEKDVTVGSTAGGNLISHPTALNKPSGPPNPTAKGTGSLSVPVASKEAAQRRTSPGAPGDVSGPMGGTPTSTTSSSAQVEKVVPPGERRNKTPVYNSGVKNTRSFLEWVRTKSATKLVAQIKGEYLMLVPETTDGFRATIGALRSLGEGEGVSFHTFSLPQDRCVRLLKNLGKRMPEAEIKGELEALHIHVQAVMQLR
jgi:hypothetical protein